MPRRRMGMAAYRPSDIQMGLVKPEKVKSTVPGTPKEPDQYSSGTIRKADGYDAPTESSSDTKKLKIDGM